MSNIPWYGWAALAFILLSLVAINIWLISSSRKKKKMKITKDIKLHTSGNALLRLGQALRNPWKTEDDMLAELSRRTAELRTSSPSSSKPDDKKP